MNPYYFIVLSAIPAVALILLAILRNKSEEKEDEHNSKYPKEPSEAAKREALKHPNGWVYALDAAFEYEEEVPSEAILGAWKVNSEGKIIGDFVPNDKYKDLDELFKKE